MALTSVNAQPACVNEIFEPKAGMNIFSWKQLMITRLLVVLLAASCGALAANAADSESVAAGRILAKRHCGRCHAIGPADHSRLRRAVPFRVIAARYSVWDLQEALAEGIVVGHPAMPKFIFTPKDIGALLSYMDTLTPAKRRPGKRP